MDPCKNNVPECNPHNCVNMSKDEALKKPVCNKEPKQESSPGKYSDCCTLSPIVQTPFLKPCDLYKKNACGQLKSVVECNTKWALTI